MKKLLALLLLAGVPAFADVQKPFSGSSGGGTVDTSANFTWTGTHNFTSGVFVVPNGTALPATCTEGSVFQDTNASLPELSVCTSTNTWTALSGIGGSTGATDNAILRADGTGGSTVQASNVTVDDTGTMTFGWVDTTGNDDYIIAGTYRWRIASGHPYLWNNSSGRNEYGYNNNIRGLTLASGVHVGWSATDEAVANTDAGLVRGAAGVVRVTNGSTNSHGLGALIGGVSVEVNTGTKSAAITESGECYTNTSDADGSTINLPNDPTIGSRVCVLLTEAVSTTVVPGAGETLKVNGVSYSTSCIASTEGASMSLIAAVGGAGGEWVANDLTGIWTCDSVRANNDSATSLLVRSTGAGTPTIFEVPASTGTGANNTLAGNGAGSALTSGFEIVNIGTNAGNTVTTGNSGVSIGYNSDATSTNAYQFVAIGDGAIAGSEGVAVGAGSSTSGLSAVAVGDGASAAQNGVAVGDGATSTGGGIAIGRVVTAGANALVLGSVSVHMATSTTVRSATGSADVQALNTEQITLSTGGATTNSSGNIVPANSIVDAIACRITTTITTATEWGVSITGDAAWNQIGTTDTTVGTLTAGTTAIFVAPAHDGQYNDTATTITITTTGTPGAGAIRCAVHSRTFTPPTS